MIVKLVWEYRQEVWRKTLRLGRAKSILDVCDVMSRRHGRMKVGACVVEAEELDV